MKRRHLIIPAAMLAGSAVLGGQAALRAMPLGAPPAVEATMTTGVQSNDQQLVDRAAQLDQQSARLDAIDAQRPPSLPPVQSRPVVASSGYTAAAIGAGAGAGAGAGGASPGAAQSTTVGANDDHRDDRDDRDDHDDHDEGHHDSQGADDD